MKVQCLECKSNYNVNDEKVPDNGTKIKCPKCENIIIIKKSPSTPPPIQNTKLDKQSEFNNKPSEKNVNADTKNCPYCAEEILAVATKCKHCGSNIVENQIATASNEKSMIVKKERSIVPMILGIIGGVVGLPGALCAGACAVGLGSLAGENDATVQAIGDFYLYLGIITALAGLVFGCIARRKPVLSGAAMIASAVLGGITLIAGNMFALVASTLFLIGGGIAIANKNRPAPSAA